MKKERTMLRTRLMREISALKKQLAAIDYKRLKNIEFAEVGKELPYSWSEIHEESQPIRDRINELQAQLAEVEGAAE